MSTRCVSLPLPLPLPFHFTTPITLHWVKRSLCAVQPRICTFYGHVYGLQLIDYAWAEWTMPEMCKCCASAASSSFPPLSISLSPGWNCMTTAQEADPPPTNWPAYDRCSAAARIHLGRSLRIAMHKHLPHPPTSYWSKLPPLPADTLWILSALSWHPGFDLPSAFVRAFVSATRC